MKPLSVTVEKLSVSLPSKRNQHKNIVENISFTAPAGKITGFIGPNGSGKSTILKCIYRYLTPKVGDIYIGDIPLTRISFQQFPYYVGVLAQTRPESIAPTGAELIGLAGTPTRKILAQVIHSQRYNNRSAHTSHPTESEALEVSQAPVAVSALSLEQHVEYLLEYRERIIDLLDLAKILHRPLYTLSGGQAQRMYLGLALANDPAIVILDEPDNHLDFSHRIYLVELLRSLGKTVLVAMHDLSLAAMLCDDIHVIHAGKIMHNGNVEQTITPPILRDIFSVEAEVFIDPRTGNTVISAYQSCEKPLSN